MPLCDVVISEDSIEVLIKLYTYVRIVSLRLLLENMILGPKIVAWRSFAKEHTHASNDS